MKAILSTFASWTMAALAAGLKALIWAEKRVFWATGRRGAVLRWYWNESGRRLQKALNREHGTAIIYGTIAK